MVALFYWLWGWFFVLGRHPPWSPLKGGMELLRLKRGEWKILRLKGKMVGAEAEGEKGSW